MTPKPKIATKHLDPCEVDDCKFAKEHVADKNVQICCFGLRHEGCIYYNRDMQRRLMLLASVEERLTVAKYEKDPWWAAETRNDQIDLPLSIDEITKPVLEKIAKITGKVYSFVYAGHEYNHRDNSMDYGSCPHCDESKGHEHIGYYRSGQERIYCFICSKCFKKFYYHNPEE